MTEARANNPAVRVVVLSADAPVRAALADAVRLGSPQAVRLGSPQGPLGVECVAVQSAYEAAAELVAGDPNRAGGSNRDQLRPGGTGVGLTSPVLALVVDLRLMSPRHLRLLQIARERDVELLAVGGIPSGLTPEDLSGVRLVARADLKAALERLLAVRSTSPAAGPSTVLGAGREAAPAVSEIERLAAESGSDALTAGQVEPAVDEGQYVSDEAPPNHETQWEPEEPPRAAPSRSAVRPGEQPAPVGAAGASRAGGDSARRGAGAAAQRAGGGNGSEPESKRSRERPAGKEVERPGASGSAPLTAAETERPAVAPAAESAPSEAPAHAAQGPAPRSILTKEELAALLEDEK